MSFIKKSQEYNKELEKWMEHFECDNESDIEDIPSCVPGSTVKVLSTGKTYTMTNFGVFDGVGGGGGGVIYVNVVTEENTDGSYSCTLDKTVEEINAKIEAGESVVMKVHYDAEEPNRVRFLNLAFFNNPVSSWSSLDYDGADPVLYNIWIDLAGVATMEKMYLTKDSGGPS